MSEDLIMIDFFKKLILKLKKLFLLNFSFLKTLDLYIFRDYNNENSGLYTDYIALKNDWENVGSYIKDGIMIIENTEEYQNARKHGK